jgi:two-component system OmpR family response regulator
VTHRGEARRVLVVDDEPSIVDVLCTALIHDGFQTRAAATGADALSQARTWLPHAIVLDVMLPDLDGFEVARLLAREQSRAPILFLSARGATSDKVRGLTAGDDYVTKPFSLEELLARLRNLLRRGATADRADDPPALEVSLRFADLELHPATRELTRGAHPIELTATELRLLHCLMLSPGRVLSRAHLLEHVWGYDFGGDARVLETYISYLRKKLDAHGPPLVHTVRGMGYALREPRPPAPGEV